MAWECLELFILSFDFDHVEDIISNHLDTSFLARNYIADSIFLYEIKQFLKELLGIKHHKANFLSR